LLKKFNAQNFFYLK
jgi:hypothetical protein